MPIILTDFARTRLFPREPRRNTIQDITPEAFERHLNAVPRSRVLDGYAPFCKLHGHRNWTSTRCLPVPIPEHNRHPPRSGYEAPRPAELRTDEGRGGNADVGQGRDRSGPSP